jgi:tripartite-type tricarboxylate transporter receptor subunit TctC
MVSRRTFISGALTLGVGPIAATLAHAQGYPDKPIKIIVAAAPGGPSDFPARLASQILPPRLHQPVVIENRGGAGGAIGARAAAAAAPDGYTLFVGNTSTLAVIPAVSSSAGYDPLKDFTPIAKVLEGFQILVVHPSAPWKSIKELVDYTKGQSGQGQLCAHRQRRFAASGRRTVHVAERRQDDRHFLSQRRRIEYRGLEQGGRPHA